MTMWSIIIFLIQFAVIKIEYVHNKTINGTKIQRKIFYKNKLKILHGAYHGKWKRFLINKLNEKQKSFGS